MADGRTYPARPILAVSAAIIRDGKVLIVRRAPRPPAAGLYTLPGGGVEVGETLVEALARELREEGNIVIDAPPVLHGVFFNRSVGNRDHVAVYVVPRFHVTGPRAPDREIVASGFFPSDRLPEGATRAVRDRLVEIFDAAPPSQTW